MPFYHGLRRAILDRNIHLVEVIISNGTSVNEKISDSGVTPLNLAVYAGNLTVLQCLLRHGADPNQSSVCQDSEIGEEEYPLMPAARLRNKMAAQLLLQHGADVNKIDSAHLSALYYAANCGHVQVTKLLLEYDADVELKTGPYGTKALHAAVRKGHVEIVTLLINHGAKVDDIDLQGNTSLHYACDNPFSIQSADFLIGRGATINSTNCNQKTALMTSITAKQWDLALLLLQHGADASIQDINNKSCMDFLIAILLQDIQSARQKSDKLVHLLFTLWQAGGSIRRPYLISILCANDEIDEDSMAAILGTFCQPKPLRFIVCSTVRDLLRSITADCSIFPLAKQLPIPNLLKSTLCFKDFKSNSQSN